MEFSPSMWPKLDLALVWRDALRVACAKLADWDKAKAEPARAALVGSTCPFDLAALTSEELDLADAIGRVQASAMPDKSP